MLNSQLAEIEVRLPPEQYHYNLSIDLGETFDAELVPHRITITTW